MSPGHTPNSSNDFQGCPFRGFQQQIDLVPPGTPIPLHINLEKSDSDILLPKVSSDSRCLPDSVQTFLDVHQTPTGRRLPDSQAECVALIGQPWAGIRLCLFPAGHLTSLNSRVLICKWYKVTGPCRCC